MFLNHKFTFSFELFNDRHINYLLYRLNIYHPGQIPESDFGLRTFSVKMS